MKVNWGNEKVAQDKASSASCPTFIPRLLNRLLLVVELYPLLWLLFSSFKTSEEFSVQPFWASPVGLDRFYKTRKEIE
jgi:hypothetical protein